MFTYVICCVVITSTPVDNKLVVRYSVTDPVKSHVDCLGCFHFYVGVGETDGGGVVDLDWGGRLRMAHFYDGDAEREGFFFGEEGGADFCFGRGALHVFHNFT